MGFNEILQEKYPHLEVSVLSLSEVQKDNESKRIDSEYFRKEYLENEEIMKGSFIIKDYLNIKIKNIKSLSLNKDFNYLQISDIDLINGLEYSCVKIEHNNLPDRATYVLKHNDICISTVRPNRNAVALIKKPKRLVGTSGFAILRLNNKSIIPEFLYIFCKTHFFITKMMRANTASLYPAILDTDIYKCQIPLLPMSFQLEIQNLVKDSHKALEESKELYKKAEETLYLELGLDPKNPLQSLLDSKTNNPTKSPNISIHTLKESFLKTGRLDSEYYQSKYEDIEKMIRSYKDGFCNLKDLVNDISSGFAFSSNDYQDTGELVLIRINNIKNATLDLSNVIYLKNEAYNLSPKDKIKKGDILISMSGSIGLSCMVRDDISAMVNQRILKISIKSFNSDVLVLLLNSFICKMQFERIGTGGVQTNLSLIDMQNILIPKIDPTTQEKIAKYIQESFNLRKKSKQLLDNAKIKVEEQIQGKI